MQDSICAPVLISVYDRFFHFKKSIESLKKNPEAINSDLFVAIDFPLNRNKESIAKWKDIITYSESISGFKSVNLIVRDKNFGAHENVMTAIDLVLSKYDCLIFSEDDNVFSSQFLNFMNQSLRKYWDDKVVSAVCGYLEPIKFLENPSLDTFTRCGFTSNGFGIWKHKNLLKIAKNSYLFNTKFGFLKFLEYVRSVGSHVSGGIIYCYLNEKFYLDFFVCDYLYMNDLRCVFPSKSLVRNIGQDGSGINSGVNCELMDQEIWEPKRIDLHCEDEFNDLVSSYVKKYHYRGLIHCAWQYMNYLKVYIRNGSD